MNNQCAVLNTRENLDAINTLKWPFSMILDRLITKFVSLFLPSKHAVVPAVTAAVPLFPAQIKRFLHVPWTINRFPIRWKFTVLKAFLSYTSRFFTLHHTRPENPIKIIMNIILTATRKRTGQTKSCRYKFCTYEITSNSRTNLLYVPGI